MEKVCGKKRKTVELKNQAKYSRRVLQDLMGHNKLKQIQRKLYTYCKEANILEFDTKKSHMIVIKEAEGRFKGEKILNKELIAEIERLGGKYRPITFLKNSELHDVSKAISKIIDVGLPNQHGFRNKKSVFNASQQIININTESKVKGAVNIDLKNAFNAVPKEAVYQVFRVVFDLNHEMSSKLAEAATYKGYMYQGCPFAPQIYNIWVIGAIQSIEKMGFKVAAYADDLTIISTERRITVKDVLAMKKRIEFWNFSINPKKVRYFDVRRIRQLDTVGLKVELEKGCAEALSYRATLKKLYMFCNLYLKQHKRATFRLNKEGNFNELVGVINGLYGWLDEGDRRYFGIKKHRKLWVKVRALVCKIRKIEKHEQSKARQRNKLLKDFYFNNPNSLSTYSIPEVKPFDNWNFQENLRFSLGEINVQKNFNYFLVPKLTFWNI